MTEITIRMSNGNLNGALTMPVESKALIIFVHGSGSGRFSRRNQHIAEFFNKNGFATLLIDLLTEKEIESDIASKKFRFDINLLTSRLIHITNFVLNNPMTRDYPLVYFSSSTGTAAAINSSMSNHKIIAIISRGGRVDLISPKIITMIRIPVLFIVGDMDKPVLEYSKTIFNYMIGTKLKELVIIRGASHFFEEPGKLDELSVISLKWLQVYVLGERQIFINKTRKELIRSFINNFKLKFSVKFRDRIEAGHLLGEILSKHDNLNKPIILGIARGGVLVADGMADKINSALMDVILIQRIRSPHDPEETIGTVDINNSINLITSESKIPKGYLEREISYQNQEIKRKFSLYKPAYENLELKNKLVIIADDGSNTGSTLIAASRYVKKFHPHRLVIAVPIISNKAYFRLTNEVDSLEYLFSPKNFKTVEDYYVDFNQVQDENVLSIMKKRSHQYIL